MNKEKHPFMFRNTKELKMTHYLGSDGLTMEETFNAYLKKCQIFKGKARKYEKDNLTIKNSTLHLSKSGYENSEQLESEILGRREKLTKHYTETFDVALFDADTNSAYKCFTGMSKRIRSLRELHQERSEELTEDFTKRNACWFTRYCILSRFIEAARKIILVNRLKKIIVVLKNVKLQTGLIEGFENEEEGENINDTEKFQTKRTPCICNFKDIKLQ